MQQLPVLPLTGTADRGHVIILKPSSSQWKYPCSGPANVLLTGVLGRLHNIANKGWYSAECATNLKSDIIEFTVFW